MLINMLKGAEFATLHLNFYMVITVKFQANSRRGLQ